jgi:predicted dehydrogenase
MTRLGVIGHGGRISSVIKQCLRNYDPNLRVVGIVDPDEAGARRRLDDGDKADVKFYSSLDELVKEAKPDALAIGTRCNMHAPYAIQAAKYPIPLYLEKPVAISMKQAIALEKAFEKSRCKVVVSFPLRVSPLCVQTKSLLDEGSVGKPVHILGVNYVPYGTCYWTAPYRNYEITGGLFLQKATHDLDYMSYLMGSNIARVCSIGTFQKVFGGKKRKGLTCFQCKEQKKCLESPINQQRYQGGKMYDHPCLYSVDCGSPETGTNEDCSSALLEFKSGANGVYTQVFFSRRDAATRGATISGYLGTINFDWYTNRIKRVRHFEPFSDTISADSGMSHFGGDNELARDFISLIKGEGASRATIQMGIQSAYSCLAARESLTTGRFEKVRQVGGA